MKAFITSKGQIFKGKKLLIALNSVANDWVQLQYAIRYSDDYASHITEETKDRLLEEGLKYAEQIRKGHLANFTILQRLNTKLTGECIALLP